MHASKLILLSVLSLLFIACDTTKKIPRVNGDAKSKAGVKARDLPSNIVAYARSYIGTPYKRRGRTPRGFDCSGLTCHVYRKFDIELEPTSKSQSRMGRRVNIKDVRPGDLVFFGIGSIQHVGVVSRVTSKSLFMVHSSSSRGVIETDVFNSGYWSKRLRFARRVF